MSEKIFETEKLKTYRFEFGSDSRVHTVSFKGGFTEEEAERMLEAAGKQTYEKAGNAIRSYLDLQRLEYSDFEFKEKILKHEKIIEFANMLLRSNACKKIDEFIGNTDHYFAVMDHQKWIGEGRCEGCYYAIKRSISHNYFDPPYKYHVIGQTFVFDDTNEGINYFTIRKKDGPSPFHNLYISKGRPVLPTFGCVDLVELLRNIGHIYNARQAKDIAIK